jgi:8-oxo-(d)GTP phosphatase
MSTTTVYLVRHAKAADRTTFDGRDRDRPLVRRGRAQAEQLAAALAPHRPALVAASPWLRCAQTAEPLAAAVGVDVALDDRLGYDGPDLPGWLAEAVATRPGGVLVGVSHGDLVPLYLLRAGALSSPPRYRTGSLFRVEVGRDGALLAVALVDRDELPAMRIG